MSRFHSYLNSAQAILKEYSGDVPFASFLKTFFSRYKKFGSKDRKLISHLCYCYFRLGKINVQGSLEERILIGLFLCSDEPNELLHELRWNWNQQTWLQANDKLEEAGVQKKTTDIFPWKDRLSEGINHEDFSNSFLVQPDLFIRIRPGYEEAVKDRLIKYKIHFDILSESSLALPNTTKIDSIVELNKEAVVQDYSSQRVGAAVLPLGSSQAFNYSSERHDRLPEVWDCCAASGGKSIMLYDLYPGIKLTVSDIRASILANLKKRFNEAGIVNYKSLVADLASTKVDLPVSDFDMIIADVPCTGSGTWSRTPEQLYFFEQEKIMHYTSLQKSIVSNVIPHIRPGGYLLYVTCSVFKEENEDAIEFVQQNFGVKLIKMEILKGYDKKADSMFAALLRTE